jgi:mannose-6-phosphate isomerase
MKDFGGIHAVHWDQNQKNWCFFAKSPYFFGRFWDPQNPSPTLPSLKSFTSFVLDNQVWQGSSSALSLQASNEPVWVAGAYDASQSSKDQVKKIEQIYTVKKPWGAEYWLSGQNLDFCFKRIVIRQGFRTSLQFHRKKEETNVLISGKVRLHYSEQKISPGNEMIELESIKTVDLAAPVSLHIFPYTLHRMEALTDLDFLEISTPEVDDVVRVSDDTQRPDGRIETEHS